MEIMDVENGALFLISAERIVEEVFEQFPEVEIEKLDVECFDAKRLEADGDNSNELDWENFAFYAADARKRLEEKLKTVDCKWAVSEPLFDYGKIVFFVIYLNHYDEKLYSKYKILFDRIIHTIFDFFTEKWKEDTLSFNNSSVCNFLIQKAIDSVIVGISSECYGGEFESSLKDAALYENINLSLPNILSALSYQTYEKSVTEGLIYFTDRVGNVDFQFKFENPEDFGRFELKNSKLIRKMLELTDSREGIGLISDTNMIYGIGSIQGDKNYWQVEYKNDHKWTVYCREKEMLTLKDNSLVFSGGALSKKEFIAYGEKVFPEKAGSDSIPKMYDIIRTLAKQGKGTILVIMKNAREYINKYRDLCMVIEPVLMDEKNVEKLSSIDGAIFMDENCMCYGFGVVLDGLDTGTGNRARGSRYNSSERFFNLYKNEEETGLMIFILSDDGNYNLFPARS